MYDSLGHKGPARGWVRTHSVPLTLTVLLLVASTGWSLTALRPSAQPAASDPADTVEVWVAARNLASGTQLTRGDLVKLTVQKPVSQGILSSDNSPDDLIGRWVNRDYRRGDVFHPDRLTINKRITLPDGMDLVSFREPAYDPTIVRGSRIDVFLKMRGGKPHASRERRFDGQEVERVLNAISPAVVREGVLPMAPAPRLKGRP